MSVFISLTLDRLNEIHVNALRTVKLIGGISGGKLEKSEGYTCIFVISYIQNCTLSTVKRCHLFCFSEITVGAGR